MVPKQIWLWWEQGWDNAPYICKITCLSYTYFNPTYNVNLVSKKNLHEFITGDINWIFKCEGPAFRADIVRLLLLRKYGGIYSDAATFCCVKLDDFINKIKFDRLWGFNIKEFNVIHDVRTLSSWFYISTKDNYIINKFTDFFVDKAKKNPINHIYLLHHECLTYLITKDEIFKKWYKDMYFISGFSQVIPAHALHLPLEFKYDKKYGIWSHLYKHDTNTNEDLYILKLRHKGIENEELLNKPNTKFSFLINRIKYSRIILVGFPKSGTSSFHELFIKSQISSVHFTDGKTITGNRIKYNKKNNLPLLDGIKEHAITQLDVCISKEEAYWPQITDYEQLYNENKNALFILNVRNVNNLIRSFKNWGNLDKRMEQYNPELFAQYKSLENLINLHYNNIRSYFTDMNAHFIEYDIDSDNISKIKKYLYLKIDNFPHKNKNLNLVK